MKQLFLFFLSTLICSTAIAQELKYHKSERINISPSGTVNLQDIQQDFAASVSRLEMPHPNSKRAQNIEMQQLAKQWFEEKKAIGEIKKRTSAKTGAVDQPIVLKDFAGNPFDGIPCDNSMAISDEGKLISVVNSMIFVYDVEADEELAQVSLSAFIEDEETISTNKYDPVVIYDYDKDRFALCFLSGTTHETSEIILAFSASNDPSAGWFKYVLDGNPLENDTWSDFPHIAMNEREIFISINTYYNGSTNNSGYAESTLWQIGKQKAFLGLELETGYFSGITYDDRPVFNLCPISGASEHYGDNMFVLSNWPFDFPDDGIDNLKNDTILLLQVTDNLWNEDREIVMEVVRSDLDYYIPVLAEQAAGEKLETNDARILGGFYNQEEDYIEFVLNGGDLYEDGTGFSGIYHGVIDNASSEPQCTGHMISDPNMSLGFAQVAYTGIGEGDRQSMIVFNHAGPDDPAGCSAIMHNQGEYSDILIVKEGETYVDQLTSSIERWGDYIGMQPRYSNPGEVWMAGLYGKMGVTMFNNHRNATWIIGLESPVEGVLADNENIIQKPTGLLYPNPAWELATYRFEVKERMMLDFFVYDQSGKLVKQIFQTECKPGQHHFRLNLKALPAGQYLLVGTGNGQRVLEEKLIVQ